MFYNEKEGAADIASTCGFASVVILFICMVISVVLPDNSPKNTDSVALQERQTSAFIKCMKYQASNTTYKTDKDRLAAEGFCGREFIYLMATSKEPIPYDENSGEEYKTYYFP